MSYRNFFFAWALLPLAAWAQNQNTAPLSSGEASGVRWNETTLTVLRLNQPKGLTEAQWLALMAKPENRVLFPLRITQGMLDTLDGRKMDLRFQYMLIPNELQHHGPQVR